MQARDILEIDSVNADILDASSLLNGLNCLQTFVLQAIGQLEQKAIKVELGRLKQREQLNNQAIANTLDNFAHIFDAEKANSPASFFKRQKRTTFSHGETLREGILRRLICFIIDNIVNKRLKMLARSSFFSEDFV